MAQKARFVTAPGQLASVQVGRLAVRRSPTAGWS